MSSCICSHYCKKHCLRGAADREVIDFWFHVSISGGIKVQDMMLWATVSITVHTVCVHSRGVKHTACWPKLAHQRVRSGPRDEFWKWHGNINCNVSIKVTAVPTLSTGGCTAFTEHLNNRRLCSTMSVCSFSTRVGLVDPYWTTFVYFLYKFDPFSSQMMTEPSSLISPTLVWMVWWVISGGLDWSGWMSDKLFL